jgi:hypothetical protein
MFVFLVICFYCISQKYQMVQIGKQLIKKQKKTSLQNSLGVLTQNSFWHLVNLTNFE